MGLVESEACKGHSLSWIDGPWPVWHLDANIVPYTKAGGLGHISRFQVQSRLGRIQFLVGLCMGGNWLMFLSNIDVSLSPSISPPLPPFQKKGKTEKTGLNCSISYFLKLCLFFVKPYICVLVCLSNTFLLTLDHKHIRTGPLTPVTSPSLRAMSNWAHIRCSTPSF